MTKERKDKIRKGLACCSKAEPLCTECPFVNVPRCSAALTKGVIEYLEEEDKQ